VRVFRWPGSVFGARCPVRGVDLHQVPGIRSQVPVPVFEKTAHRVCKMQDMVSISILQIAYPMGAFFGTWTGNPAVSRPSPPVSGFGTGARSQVPGTWYPAPEPNRRRGPDTEHRGPSPTCTPGLHPASCIF